MPKNIAGYFTVSKDHWWNFFILANYDKKMSRIVKRFRFNHFKKISMGKNRAVVELAFIINKMSKKRNIFSSLKLFQLDESYVNQRESGLYQFMEFPK